MATAGNQLRATIVAVLQASAGVAAQSGLSLAVWGSTSIPHVFDGAKGASIGHKNRGRLPFIEVSIEQVPYHQDSREGGTMTSTVRLRAHVTGTNQAAAEQMAEGLLGASMAAIRNPNTPNLTYLTWGEYLGTDAFVIGALWHTQDAHFTVDHSYDSSTFEVT